MACACLSEALKWGRLRPHALYLPMSSGVLVASAVETYACKELSTVLVMG